MRYFVFAEDGNKYGPADVALLNQWIEEGRLLPDMVLEEDGSKHRVAAASIAGLDFYVLDQSPQPDGPGNVAAMVFEPPPTETVGTDLLISWSMVAATLILAGVKVAAGFLGIFTTVLGLVAAIKARERGSETAGAAVVVNMLALVVWIAARVIYGLRS